MLQQLLTISRNTLVESIRQPIFVVLILVGAVALVLNPQLAAYTMEDDNKLLIDFSLSTVFLVGLLLAAFTATGVLASEIENRTALTVVSKPVPRPIFVLGKYLGVSGAIALAFYTLSLIFLFTLRHRVMTTASDEIDQPVVVFSLLAALGALAVATLGNYLYRWVFTSVFVVSLAAAETLAFVLVLMVGKGWVFQSPLTDIQAHDGEMGQVMIGLVLVFEAVLILTAVAIAISTRLGQIMTLVGCIVVFAVGLISNSFSQWSKQQMSIPDELGTFRSVTQILGADAAVHLKSVYLLAQGAYIVVPNLQFFWPGEALNMGNPFSAAHVVTVTGYAAMYIGVVLCLAVALFQTREMG